MTDPEIPRPSYERPLPLSVRAVRWNPHPRRAIATALDRMRRDSILQRRTLLLTIGITVLVTALITVILTVLALTSSASTADRLAAAGDVLVGATLLLAAIAALVALLAYAVSTGLPDIRIQVQFDTLDRRELNNPRFYATIRNDVYEREEVGSWRILLRNESRYSAKNPALVIRFDPMGFSPGLPDADPKSFTEHWAVIDHNYASAFTGGSGYDTVQWDGGPTYSIHGHSTRRLPDLDVYFVWYHDYLKMPVPPHLTFEILAEGYRKVVTMPAYFVVDGESIHPRKDEIRNPEWM